MNDFDATKYLTKVSGKDYLEVKFRLVWLRSVQPDASIVTEMTHFGPDMAVFKATVSWPTETGIAQCTGWGQEEAADFGDFLEKAETKAIGRALAAAGYGTQFCQDHEFGADQQRVVDSPVNVRGQRAPAPQQPKRTATADDMARIATVLRGPLTTGAYNLLMDEITALGIGNDDVIGALVHEANARRATATQQRQPALVD